MGWGEMRAVPQHYSDEIQRIDESMLRLYGERRRLAGKKRMFPPKETLLQWSSELGLEVDVISRFLHAMNAHAPMIPAKPESPIGVLPIMKKARAMNCTFLITHALQYERYSELAVEAKLEGEAEPNVSLRPMLDLVVLGENADYETRSIGRSGGGMRAELRFQVAPRLPDDMSGIGLSLVPGGYSLVHEVKEIRLDHQVDFE
ncbi:hypothetical protein SD70_23535 [Gordoniibacillus kamchatkensis]|uniref:Uncharacterized protein n=1 Tax=Gordoniibacillus kamchatkensis TaxID=1590651 RepID=A0ABR5AD10_9BACL|nr:hypothetical protein [Paenibacillus sp. VKM B-2647]KIL38923.1 hypothetical protein SD70_23535 [Paenibacillus sp. VKM B-2647]